jgi:HlyD family secretion protein
MDNNMKTNILIIAGMILLAGCKGKTNIADAYGNFEATEVIVSAETSGRILKYEAREGSLINKDSELALIDTTTLYLQKKELLAGIISVRTKIGTINAQNEIVYQQIENLKVNIDRIQKMMKDDAATQKQLDDLTGQVAVFEKQIIANNTQKSSVMAELALYDSKLATINEQLKKSTVRSPLSGTIIEKYSEEGEFIAAGRPLAKISDLSIVKLKAYVSGAQLEKIKTGQICQVRTDSGKDGYKTYDGTISFISEKAEFTPKIIQTKDERVSLVYAVKIDVVNDGSLKSGMPGEMIFSKKSN